MPEHPIVFNGDMTKAILDGRKTQTRRIIKLQPPNEYHYDEENVGMILKKQPAKWDGKEYWRYGAKWGSQPNCNQPFPKCLYGEAGDRLWVRETWDFRPMGGACAKNRIAIVGYKTDGATKSVCVPEDCNPKIHKKWRSPIHMFQWATRIWLEITGIRVEMLQDISEEDAKAEGVKDLGRFGVYGYEIYADTTKAKLRNLRCGTICKTARRSFHSLWDSLNAKRGYGWDKNPWVRVTEFKRLQEKADA